MICLAGMIFLPRKIILCIGIVLIAAHNLLDSTHFPENNFTGYMWGFLHDQKVLPLGQFHTIMFAYPIIPWIGIMALGYCLGEIFAKGFDGNKRKRILLTLGSASLLLFIIIRGINIYGNIIPWTAQSSATFSFLSFIDISKYPPSLDYLLLTEGVALIFLALTEKISNGLTKFISVYGRVPMFYYLLHIYLIHLIAVLLAVLTGRSWTDMVSFDTWINYMPNLKGYGFNLGVVYLIWITVVLLLYPLCKWYDGYKSGHRNKWWLSYL